VRGMAIDWTAVDFELEKATADMLVILNCCYAGVSSQPRHSLRGTQRKFQYIVACEADQKTRSAGSDSFTPAIIWVPKRLLNEPVFTTRQLVRKLRACEGFRHNEQVLFVFRGRFGSMGEDIRISPTTGKTLEAMPGEQPTTDTLRLRPHT
jgi:hypothetical protein